MSTASASRLTRWLVLTVALLAGLAAAFVGVPRAAGAAGAGVAGPAVLADPLGSTPVVGASGWIIGTPPANGYGVILHTSNDGQLWVRQGLASDIPNAGLNNVKAVDRKTAWVVGNADSGYGVILRTADAGVTWVRQGRTGMVPNVAIFGVGPVDRTTAWAVGQAGVILRTHDRGQTWTRQASGTTADLYEVEAVDAQTAWAVGGTTAGQGIILHTINGGRTWRRQGTAATIDGRNFIDLTAVNAQTAWAVGGHGLLLKTADGGRHWRSQMVYGVSDNNGVCAVNGKTAWVASDYGALRRTTDGGTVWNEQEPTLPGGFYLLGVSALGPRTAWVVGGGTAIPAGGIILHTTDAGATWQIQTTPVDVTLRRVSLAPPTPAIKLKLGGLTRGALPLGRRVTAKGAVTPSSLAGSKVKLSLEKKRDHQWVTVKIVRRTIAAGGAYRWTFRLAKAGAYRVRVTIAKAVTHTAARTTWRTFRVK
jgi:photosystem II stability/assembly factor-like uncharacterized protein